MNNHKEAERRLRILIFWEKYGDDATNEAFHVGRRTLYRWQASLRKEGGKLRGLDKKSTAPKRKRTRNLPEGLETKILLLREQHYRLGKKKIAVLCGLSESKTGRVLSDFKKRGLLPQQKKLSFHAKTGRFHERKHVVKPKIRRTAKHGLEVDTIVRFMRGVKRYVYTAIDVERKFSFAGAYTRHSSKSASDFLKKLIEVTPFHITEIQTDNGSEFADVFHDECMKRSITHYHTYPRCPKMNGTVERFNRTLSEDLIQRHLSLLRDDIASFNDKLIDWLIWYNTERPHQSLGILSPLRYIVSTLTEKECQMLWTRTIYFKNS